MQVMHLELNHDGRYRTTYLKRKDVERAKAEAAGLTVAPAAKIPKKRAAEFMSEGHVHRRAQRYMEKPLLRDLWHAVPAPAEPVGRRAIRALPRAQLGARKQTPSAHPVAAE